MHSCYTSGRKWHVLVRPLQSHPSDIGGDQRIPAVSAHPDLESAAVVPQ